MERPANKKPKPCNCGAASFPHRPASVKDCNWLDHAFNEGTACADCSFFTQIRESHGFKDGHFELISDCKLSWVTYPSPSECMYFSSTTLPNQKE